MFLVGQAVLDFCLINVKHSCHMQNQINSGPLQILPSCCEITKSPFDKQLGIKMKTLFIKETISLDTRSKDRQPLISFIRCSIM